MRLDVKGWNLPLRPELLADLNIFEVGHICMVLKLDDEQTSCIEAAVEAVQAGKYPTGVSASSPPSTTSWRP